jgi:hypothetical protein
MAENRRNAGSDEPAHDVLAAEEFAVPASDPSLHHGPVRLPVDPTGISEPHDVLAAEEFAMPAPPLSVESGTVTARGHPSRAAVVAVGATVVVLLRRLRRR